MENEIQWSVIFRYYLENMNGKKKVYWNDEM